MQLRKNVLANVAASGWSAVAQLAFVPIYIRLLGIEAYGLVGFSLILQGCLQALDLGLGPTLNRELARAGSQPGLAAESRNLVRTIQSISWIVSLLIGGAIVGLAPWIADRWLQVKSMSREEVVLSVRLMGAWAALQWPFTLAQAGLMGMQRIVAVSAIRIAGTTLGVGGGVAVLLFVGPKPSNYFLWQGVILLGQIWIMHLLLWRGLAPSDRPARVDLSLLKTSQKFAAGMLGINLASLALMQMDKVLLCRMLPMDQFGYYSLAAVVSSGLYIFMSPVFNSYFPRLSSLVAAGSEEELIRMYHGGSQLTAVLVFPLAAVLAAFPVEAIQAWTGNPETAARAAPLLRLFVLGTGFNALMVLPYALQLAYGAIRLPLYVSAILAGLQLPALILLTQRLGALGGALTWLLVNMAYVAVGIPLTHARMLKGEARSWCLTDVGPPFLAVCVLSLTPRLAFPGVHARWESVALVVGVTGLCFGGAICFAPVIRRMLWQELSGFLGKGSGVSER